MVRFLHLPLHVPQRVERLQQFLHIGPARAKILLYFLLPRSCWYW